MRKPNTQACIRPTVLLPLPSIVSIMAGLAAGITLCITSLPTYAQGSREHPVTITTRTELESINATGHYQLGKDIDLGDSPWTPLFPDINNGFSGTLLDNGFVLRNLNMTSDGAFIYYLGSDSRVELRFDNAKVSVTGSGTGTGIALGILYISGDNNQLTLRVSNSQIDAKGNNINSIALLVAQNRGSNNQLSLLDSQAVNLTTDTNGKGSYAALGLAYSRGKNITLTLARLHNIKLDTETRYIGSALGIREVEIDIADTKKQIFVENISGLDIVSRYSGTDDLYIGLLAGFLYPGKYSTESVLTARAVSGEIRILGNTVVILEALAAGATSSRGFIFAPSAFLGVNSNANSNALIGRQSDDINCTQVHWDTSLNGRTQSGCLDNTGHGHYSHTPEGWEALWVALDINPDQQVPGEQQWHPEGDAEQLLTQQTYHHRLHPDGYYDQQGQFQANGTGPLILRSLTLSPNQLNITLGTPTAVNVTRDPDGFWQHNQTHFTLLNLDSGQIQWRTLNLASRELGPVNSLEITGTVLTHDSDNLFSYEQNQHLIYHYRLADQVVHHYEPNPAFNPQARFAVGLDNSLVQAVPDGNGQVTLGPALFCRQTCDPVTVTYGEDDFRLLVQADPNNSQGQQVILLPANAQRVNGKVVRIQEPEYPWNAFGWELNVSATTTTIPIFAGMPVSITPMATTTFSQLSATVTSTTDTLSPSSSPAYSNRPLASPQPPRQKP